MENVSVVTLFTLSGLNFKVHQRIVLFVLTLLWYIIIVLANSVVIAVVIKDKSLHEPMYIFLCNLCLNALCGTVGFYPKFLLDLFFSHVITYAGCMLQGYVIHSSMSADFSLLALMAFDRYVAICRPLSYHSIMTRQRVSVFLFFAWFVPLLCMFMNTASLLDRKLCGSHIHRLYCINWMVASLACSPSTVHTAVAYANMLFFFGIFVCILYSYIYLLKTCVSSRENIQKFMQTCLPHSVTLTIYSFSVLLDLLYTRFGSASLSQDLSNFMAIGFLLIPPVTNPLIYGLNLTKIRRQVLKFFYVNKKMHSEFVREKRQQCVVRVPNSSRVA